MRVVNNRFTKKAIGTFYIEPGADLYEANLQGADLIGATLSSADLTGTDLRDADLRDADLRAAYLVRADLRGADLRGASFEGANLDDADLRDAKLPKFQIPQSRSLIVWKALQHGRLCKLRIPQRAARTASLIGNKCRAERAVVLEIWEGRKRMLWGYSMHDTNFKYEVGKEVSVSDYDGDPGVECTTGIHFFMSKKGARDYLR